MDKKSANAYCMLHNHTYFDILLGENNNSQNSKLERFLYSFLRISPNAAPGGYNGFGCYFKWHKFLELFIFKSQDIIITLVEGSYVLAQDLLTLNGVS